ncbi:AraC family transcriptional regulator [Sinomicrobium sp. M5D2P9]
MKNIQVLHIEEFGKQEEYPFFYSNTFREHSGSFHETITVPHKHNFFVMVLFTRGHGVHEIDFNSYAIKPGSVFLMYPGQTHYWKFSEDADGYVVFHTQEFYEMHYTNRSIHGFPFYYSTQNPPCLYLDKADMLKTETVFREIHSEYEGEDFMKMQRIASLLDLLYINLSRLYLRSNTTESPVSVTYMRKIRQLEQLIEMHYMAEKLPSAYADMMHISPKHLNRMVKTSLRKTTSDLIAERVILEAKRLLVHSQNSFTEIARALGYEDYAYFSRLFKQKTGLTPSGFVHKYE